MLFTRLQGSAKIRSDHKLRSDLENNSAGASGQRGQHWKIGKITSFGNSIPPTAISIAPGAPAKGFF